MSGVPNFEWEDEGKDDRERNNVRRVRYKKHRIV